MSFIAGAYTATYDASALGQLQDGLRLEFSFFKKIITGDNFADTPQDAIYRGSQAFIQFICLEYNAAAVLKAIWPYGTVLLNMATKVGNLDSAQAKSLVLTSTANTPAATAPATLTLPRSILAPNYPINLLFAPDLRTVPLRKQCYIDASGVYGTLT